MRGVGEWMVAAIVMPLVTRPFTTSMTSLAVKESKPVGDRAYFGLRIAAWLFVDD